MQELRPASRVVQVPIEDGAVISCFIYSPVDVKDQPGTPFAIDQTVPALVCLHGNSEDHTIMAPVIEAVRDGRTVIAIDSRGQGASTRGTAPLTYQRMAKDSLEALSRMGVTQAHVLGYSDGGIIGIMMAATARHRVLSLTTIGANMRPEGLHENVRQGMMEELKLTEDPGHAELIRLMLTQPHINPSDLRTVVCPTCVMTGEDDVVKPEESERLFRALPSSRLVVVPRASHDLIHEATMDVLMELFGTMAITDRPRKVRPPRANPDLVVCRVGPDRMAEVDVVYEAVLDACEGSDPDTSGWKRGVWPPAGAIAAHAEKGHLWCAFDKADCDENGEPDIGAIPLGCMALDHDMAIADELLDYEDQLDSSEYLVLHSLAVNPAVRGRGVADTLMAEYFEEGRREGVKALRLNTSPDNVSANRLYSQRGFRLNRPVHLAYRGLRLSPWSNLYDLPLE